MDVSSYPNTNATADSKNEKSKQLIKDKISEYIGRAEVLKEHLAAANQKKAKSAVGVNGSSGGAGGAKYVCNSLVRCAPH